MPMGAGRIGRRRWFDLVTANGISPRPDAAQSEPYAVLKPEP